MASKPTTQAPVFIGAVVKDLNQRYPGSLVKDHHVRRLFQNGILPEPDRVGIFRLIPQELVPRIEKALIESGFIVVDKNGGAA